MVDTVDYGRWDGCEPSTTEDWIVRPLLSVDSPLGYVTCDLDYFAQLED